MFAPNPDPKWMTKLMALMQRVSGFTDARRARFYENRWPRIRERMANRQGPKLPPMPFPSDLFPVPTPIGVPLPSPTDRPPSYPDQPAPRRDRSNPRDPNRY